MKIYNSVHEITTPIKNAVVTSGTFDGLHLGHQKIISRINDIAKKQKGESVIFTFAPHPRHFLFPEKKFELLTSIDEKAKVFEALGVDHLIIQPFNKDFANISTKAFINEYLETIIGTKHLVIGYDHKFGKNREGSFEYLNKNKSQYQFSIEEISKKDIDDTTISSTAIRNFLNEGNVESANSLLGRPYSITGTVVEGKKIGRTINFPTANLAVSEKKLIPKNGAYAVKVIIDNKQYKGMLNIGVRPTVSGTNTSIEVNIFDFNQDLYDTSITIELIEKLRDEYKFDSITELKNQLEKDKKSSLKILE